MSTTTDIISYRVLKSESNKFVIDYNGEPVSCYARKKIKKDSDIMVGDFVCIEKIDEEYIVKNVQKRSNFLVRPSVANIDQIVIIAAPVPKIDFMLIDKLIINSNRQNLDVILCLNKSDLSLDSISNLEKDYGEAVNAIIYTSAVNSEIEELRKVLKNKLSCFAGQSAVGKSSITNVLINSCRQQIGDISEKNQRGKNTTTKAEIIMIEKDTYIVDTPGFSMLDIHEIRYDELDLYYNEYVKYSSKCKFNRCTHTSEPDCEIKSMALRGELSAGRYERYVMLFNELKSNKQY